MIPHERSLVKRLEGKPFVLVGVNSDGPEGLKKVKALALPWRSFKDRRTAKPPISEEWKVHGWPTLYLIDHEGIIRARWIDNPGPEVLDREIDRLIAKARR